MTTDDATPKPAAPAPAAPAAPRAVGWTDSPTIAGEHILPLVAHGTSEGHWLLDMFSTLPIPRNGAWLSLHCGGAGLEFLALQRGLFATLDGYDPSPQAIATARGWVAQHGIGGVRFDVGTVPDIDPAPASCDVVLSNFTLHRVSDLDGFLARLERALRPGGWLILNEYVGPRYFQYHPRQLQIVEELLAALPGRLRLHWPSGGLKSAYVPPPVAHFLAHAPHEAVSSEEIVGQVDARFELVSRRDYGGSILSPLLEGIIGNFDENREDELALLRLLATFERVLLREGLLASDFTVLVARKRVPGDAA